MQVFTVLLIYYHVYSTDMVSEIWFENYAQCEKVLRSEALEIIYKQHPTSSTTTKGVRQ